MENLKKIFQILLISLLCISFISAFDFDNVKSYDLNTKTAIIKNCDLWIATCLNYGETIAEAKLISEYHVKVPTGYQKIAEFEINNLRKSTYPINKIDSYNKKNMTKITKNYDYKYWKITGEKNVNDYETQCNYLGNGSINTCNEIVIGSHKENIGEWLSFDNSAELPIGKIKIGLFTNVYSGDYIEWIPKLFGVEIEEWASFGVEEWVKHDLTLGGACGGAWTQGVAVNFSATKNITAFNTTGATTDFIDGSECYVYNITDVASSCTPRIIANGTFSTTTHKCEGFNTTVIAYPGDQYIFAGKHAGGTNCQYNGGSPYPIERGDLNFSTGWGTATGGTCATSTQLFNIGAIFYQNKTSDTPLAITILISPADNLLTINKSLTFDSSANAQTSNLTNATIFIWNPDNSLFSTNTTITGGSTNTTNISISGIPVNNSYLWNVEWCSVGVGYNCSFAPTNRTFNISAYEVKNVTFNNQTYEGSQETFTARVLLGEGNSITQAIFNYNNTNYSTNINYGGGEYLITSTISVPLVESLTNFSLRFILDIDEVFYDLENFTQEVFIINLSSCVGTIPLLINMSLRDEITKELILGTIETNAQAISKSSGDVVSSINVNFTNMSYGALCLSPSLAFSSLYLDSEIKYYSDNYEPELYYIQKGDMSDYPKNLSLFDLSNNLSTKFTIKYQDNNLISVEGAIIQLQRKYISEGIYEIVEAPLTSDSGTSILHIDLNSNRYQATVVKEGEVLDIFTNIVFNCESELTGQCTHKLLGKIDSENDESVIGLRDFYYLISSVNNTITTLFSIPSGTPSTINIQLSQIDMFGNKTQCNQTIISSGGSIDCTYDNTIGDSILDLKIFKDSELQAEQGYAVVDNAGFSFLGNNYIIVVIMLLSVIGMAFASPEIIIIITIVMLALAGAFWLLNGLDFVIGLGSLAFLIIASIIIIYKLAKQEDH